MTAAADTVRDLVRERLPAGTLLLAADDHKTLHQLGFDSLEVVELAVAIEDAFPGIEIPEIDTRWITGSTIAEVIADVARYAK